VHDNPFDIHNINGISHSAKSFFEVVVGTSKWLIACPGVLVSLFGGRDKKS
jgi:hypothetical protein